MIKSVNQYIKYRNSNYSVLNYNPFLEAAMGSMLHYLRFGNNACQEAASANDTPMRAFHNVFRHHAYPVIPKEDRETTRSLLTDIAACPMDSTES